MNLRTLKSVLERRKEVEKQLSLSLKHTGTYSIDEESASTKNCENMIGVTQVPLGLAGPILIKESLTESTPPNTYYLPLATTEGALVASVNRGCKAISESGGAVVDSYRVGATRGPVFKVKSLRENDQLNAFLEKNFPVLQKLASNTSTHLRLIRYYSRGLGRYRYIRFIFDSQDAMGMNMVTLATEKIVRYLEEETRIPCITLAGNYDVDKKAAWLNVIEGRGMKVWAEAVLPDRVLREVLKTTAKQVYEVWLAKCLLGSAMAGSISYNAQFANVVAALFIATGQDPAHVVEGSLGLTTTEIVSPQSSAFSLPAGQAGHQTEEDLYVSVYMPDLMVGTVGGGTGLAAQQEALAILGVKGGNNGRNSQKLAEIIASAVLAGEISLLASLEEGSLGAAHQRLGRGKK